MEHRKVLVVDALNNIEAMIQGGLLYYPVEMSFSTNKSDALKQIIRQPPDLLISCLIYEDGSALDLISEVKSILDYVPPGIFLADSSQEEAQKEVLKLGAVDVITRPFDVSVLHKKIDHAVSMLNAYNKKSRLEKIVHQGPSSEEFDLLVEESKSLGIPVAELIKLKQLSS